MSWPDASPPPTTPLTEEQARALERERQLVEDADARVAARRQRLRNHLGRVPKEEFVREFMDEGRIADYPVMAAEIADANEVDYQGHYLGQPLVTIVECEVRRAYDRHPFSAQSARSVACDILNSSGGSFLFSLRASPALSTELVLAHLETLGFQLPPPVAFSVAVRVTLALLNRALLDRAWREDKVAEATPF